MLLKLKIHTRTIYPYPIQKMKAYRSIIKNKKDLKTSEIKAKDILFTIISRNENL